MRFEQDGLATREDVGFPLPSVRKGMHIGGNGWAQMGRNEGSVARYDFMLAHLS